MAVAQSEAQSAAQPVAVPSGQQVTLTQVLIEEQSTGGPLARFRFLAPRIAESGGDIAPDQAAADMDHLCKALVLPYLAQYALEPDRVVISLSDREVPFGKSVPEATQFFEAYRPGPQGCVWEEF
ncbi:acetolactate synthase [Pukyongiella litopenaei]|uniref:Acetolactate synthase n=2 Tax=Pukyongiella litopenaei TaxID=2605946 RepID=A0A2S0MUQ7_9RHOB|nr:acetolactate synthase [Pukyongiella litopenaei]